MTVGLTTEKIKNSFNTLSARAAQGPFSFEVGTDGEIRSVGYLRRRFNELVRSQADQEKHAQSIKAAIYQLDYNIPSEALTQDGSYSPLFNALQKYNQVAIQTFRGSFQLPPLFSISDDPKINAALLPARISLAKKITPEAPPTATVPHKEFVLAAGTISRFSVRQIHPEDLDAKGRPVNHSSEALRILLATQWERLKSTLGKIGEVVGRTFGFKIDRFKPWHYFSHNETAQDYMAKASPIAPSLAPTSHWLGHASLFLSVPLKADHHPEKISNFNIITDPVEGDLQALLYPRQTPFATSMEELPATHVFLLSHGHLDHFSAPTIAKLLEQQPAMIVPKKDGKWFRDRGFTNVAELDWWETQSISLKKGREQYTMKVKALPARHWSGRGPLGGHESGFQSYLIQGQDDVQDGILFSGDTARISEADLKGIRASSKIRWMFEPGGPDEERRDMESTHQSSADALWKHLELLFKPLLEVSTNQDSLEKFLIRARQLKTVFMHTMTFKLGTLHLNDTRESVKKVLNALRLGPTPATESEELKPYEAKVLEELRTFCEELVERFRITPYSQEHLSLYQKIAGVLRETVLVPKIGSRIDLGQSKESQSDQVFDRFLLKGRT